ncbi:MAG TPA: glycosyltransferase family 4 protein [Syntrophales bacterium]|nr:glycosyltransferase family 4 protein [Syntrophales bacterium]
MAKRDDGATALQILMFGWEFPPTISGGLGTACFGMTRALVQRGHRVSFVVPSLPGGSRSSHVELLAACDFPTGRETAGPTGITVGAVESPLQPYMAAEQYKTILEGSLLASPGHYGPDLFDEVRRYGEAAGVIARRYAFDVIHAHEWLSVRAALHARQESGRPFIFHIHALEFDRSGGNGDPRICAVERLGLDEADHVITVSHYTKGLIVEQYGTDAAKVTVVHNAVSRDEATRAYQVVKQPGEKIVLFLGRITHQKGPGYFVEAAAKVLRALPGVTFVMAGSGDLMPQMVERVAELGMGSRFLFTGFLRGGEVERMFAASDLYVMPSVSEPFGIAPLEAMLYDVPVIITRQSGVAEVLHHALTVDFWDVDELANKICAALTYDALTREMVERSREELKAITWDRAARQIEEVYKKVISGR